MAKDKVLVVIQRYGREVVGGESLCRQVMGRLKKELAITVATTCARDYVTWADYFRPGRGIEEGIDVIRFPVARKRNPFLFSQLSRIVLQRRLSWRPPLWMERLWAYLQGPNCPGLLRYVERNHSRYDAVIFFTYLYYHAIKGIPKAGGHSILVPFAHDERPIYLSLYRDVFRLPSALIYMTEEEQEFANALFDLSEKPQRIASTTVPTISSLRATGAFSDSGLAEFINRHSLESPYFLYLGRVDPTKGMERLFSYFERYLKERGADCLLVLAGSQHMDLPAYPWLRYLGFLSESDKRNAIAGCCSLVLLSEYESLSIVLLEAFSMQRPAIVNGASKVLQGQIERSAAGHSVENYKEFRSAVDAALNGRLEELGSRGLAYVEQNYSWERIEDAYLELIKRVAAGSSRE